MKKKERDKICYDFISKMVSGDPTDGEILLYQSILPNKLYRYRECNKFNFDAVNGNYLYLATANKFDDPTDTTIELSSSKNYQEFELTLTRQVLEKMADIINNDMKSKGKNVEVSDSDIQEVLSNNSYDFTTKSGGINTNKLSVKLRTAGYSNKEIGAVKRWIKEQGVMKFSEVAENAKKGFIELLEDARRHWLIGCFTTDTKSGPMWENYAKKYTGFCVEYTIPKQSLDYEQLRYISPIIYGKKEKIDALWLLTLAHYHGMGQPNNEEIHAAELLIQKHMRTKEKNYSYEKEWRLMIPTKTSRNLVFDNKVAFPFISAIYMGMNISIINEKKLIRLSKKLGIRLYKQDASVLSPRKTFREVKWLTKISRG